MSKIKFSWIGSMVTVVALWATAGFAVELGPIEIKGFAKYELSKSSNQCKDCQLYPGEDKQKLWADEIAPNKVYGTAYSNVSLLQPYVLLRPIDLGKGFKLSGLLSQRWRNLKVDIPGVYYERNVRLTHEDYGSLQLGGFPTRAWSVADYPYGTHLGIADAWGASGSGYGLLTHAVRYESRPLDFLDGDLHLEYTYDFGDSGFRLRNPAFHEVYIQYIKDGLILDIIAQDAKNGLPTAWTHGPFRGVVVLAGDEKTAVDNGLAENHQSLLMLMARYPLNAKVELSGGIRRNSWSGAKAVVVGQDANGNYIWNNMFNYDWAGQKAYSASSVDFSLGLRYKYDAKWTASTGLVYLGKARTQNPAERGQSNSMLINTIGLGYEYLPGLTLYGFAGMVHFDKKGLSPLSAPSNSAFTGVDSRLATSGNWGGIGMVYVF
ncbi:MAG: hypothetical protein QM520_01760 [Gammaproteobacteria bacterium]|nr:hypothetical protein [Gammaproteobacteria bacterium]